MTSVKHLIFVTLIALPLVSVGSKKDIKPPTIYHQATHKQVNANDSIRLYATVMDDAGIKEVTVYYRATGAKSYRPLSMASTTDDTYLATLHASDIGVGKLEYYIVAIDVNGNTVLRGGKLFPITIAIAPAPVQVKKKNKTWLWVLGGVAAGAVAISALASDGNGDDNTGTIEITASPPP